MARSGEPGPEELVWTLGPEPSWLVFQATALLALGAIKGALGRLWPAAEHPWAFVAMLGVLGKTFKCAHHDCIQLRVSDSSVERLQVLPPPRWLGGVVFIVKPARSLCGALENCFCEPCCAHPVGDVKSISNRARREERQVVHPCQVIELMVSTPHGRV